MVKRFSLTCFWLLLLRLPATAHDIGFGDQLLQPVTAFHSLLPLLAVGLLCRQHPRPPSRAMALMLSLGLIAGLSSQVHLHPSQSQLVFALTVAAIAGSLVALACRLSDGALSFVVLALGIAIGTNLSFETTDWMDLSQTLLGAFAGAMAVLYVLATTAAQTTQDWHKIGVRVIGSWIFACATMVGVLEARHLV